MPIFQIIFPSFLYQCRDAISIPYIDFITWTYNTLSPFSHTTYSPYNSGTISTRNAVRDYFIFIITRASSLFYLCLSIWINYLKRLKFSNLNSCFGSKQFCQHYDFKWCGWSCHILSWHPFYGRFSIINHSYFDVLIFFQVETSVLPLLCNFLTVLFLHICSVESCESIQLI